MHTYDIVACVLSLLFSFDQESILDYNNDVQLSLISKAFLGAASASKGKRLELSDRVFCLLIGCYIYPF
jgi:hypothetical protein